MPCRERLEKLQQHVLRQGVQPANFLPVVCDITKDAEVAALPKIVAKRWPDCGIDVLVSACLGAATDSYRQLAQVLGTAATAAWRKLAILSITGHVHCKGAHH